MLVYISNMPRELCMEISYSAMIQFARKLFPTWIWMCSDPQCAKSKNTMCIKNRIQAFYSISHFTAWKQNIYVLKASPASFWEIFIIQFIMQNLHLMLDSNLAMECVNLSADKWLMQPELIQQCPHFPVLRDGILWMYCPTKE